MIAEGLKYLSDLATKAMSPQIIPGVDERRVYYTMNGEQHVILKPGSPRMHVVRSMDEIVALAKQVLAFEADPVVWYHEDGIVLILNDNGDRRDKVVMGFELSDLFKTARNLRSTPQWFTPKSFVRLLRVELAGTMEPSVLLNHVKTLKFDNGQTTKVEIDRNRQSLASEVRSKVESVTEIPEEVVLDIPVYKTLGLKDRYGLRCSVEIDPAEGKLQLLPLPDEIERVQHLAIGTIAEYLETSLDPKIPHYYGSPS